MTDANPYRGWTMVERNGHLYMTRDDRRYVMVCRLEAGRGWSHEAFERFRRMVDEYEDEEER